MKLVVTDLSRGGLADVRPTKERSIDPVDRWRVNDARSAYKLASACRPKRKRPGIMAHDWTILDENLFIYVVSGSIHLDP